MTIQNVRVLHVEDDTMQQQLIAHHLRQVQEMQFEITCVRGEREAVAEFARRPVDLVIVDYQLDEGNGLSCLRDIRRQCSFVPIIAVSGKASSEIAAELLKGGADDYISKRDLTSDMLAQSVRLAMKRADVMKRRGLAAARSNNAEDDLRAKIEYVSKYFLARLGSPFWEYLAECESAARANHLGVKQVDAAFDEVVKTLIAGHEANESTRRALVRPLVLELRARLNGEAA
jgi:DNA-binding response OmpR family regulator